VGVRAAPRLRPLHGQHGLRPDEAIRLQFREVTIVENEATGETILEIQVRGKRGVSYCKSMSGAVIEALREKLARLKTNSTKERIAKIRKEVAKQLKGEPLPDHADLLYDERGLPK